MYGFLEKELAELLNFSFEPFALNSGSSAVIVSREDFDKAKSILTEYWRWDDQENAARVPRTIGSDIAGMKIIMMPYYFDIGVLEGLTGGEVKESEEYTDMMHTGSFSKAGLTNFINQLNEEEEEEEEDTETVPDKIKEVGEEEEFLKDLDYLCSAISRIFSDNNKSVYIARGSNVDSEDIRDLADALNKNIVVVESATKFSEIKAGLKKDLIEKYLIVLIVDPSLFPRQFSRHLTGVEPMIFGRKTNRYHVVRGELVNKKISDVENDDSKSRSQKEEDIEKIKSEGSNSPYGDYDMIFKDTVTNVPFAVKDRNFIYLLFSPLRNESLAEMALKEIGRRFYGKISYDEMKEIDGGYQNSLIEEERDAYVNFSISNSSAIIDELKVKFEEHKAQYQDHLQKAMEHGKLMRKFMQQIDVFDYEKHRDEERKKANDEYNMTLSIGSVASINISEETVNVYTHNIYAKDERSKKIHDIGTFHIRLGLLSNRYSTSNSVRILNTKHLIKAYSDQIMQAPHIFENGTICHGGLATGMTEAYLRRDLYQLILQLILFLQQANTDDPAGKTINLWPEVDEASMSRGPDYGLKIKESKITEEDKVIADADKEFDEVFAGAIEI